jgi:hypothetical protein
MSVRGCLLIALVGCTAHHRAPATPPSHTPEPAPPGIDAGMAADLTDAFIETLATMAQITREPDCARMGSQLAVLFEHSRDLFAQANRHRDDPASIKILADAMNARADQIPPLEAAIGPGLTRCRNSTEVIEAMANMPTFDLSSTM